MELQNLIRIVGEVAGDRADDKDLNGVKYHERNDDETGGG